MNRLTQSLDGTILFRMSNEAEYYNDGRGVFEVRYGNIHTQLFPTLLEAFLFYYTVDAEAELWDKTGKPLLIENKVMLHLN